MCEDKLARVFTTFEPPRSIVCFLRLALLLSELEPRVERARLPPSPVRSDLRASAVLRADPDPHLLGLPDLSVPLGSAAAVVLGVDAPNGVSERNTSPQPEKKRPEMSENEQVFILLFLHNSLCVFPLKCVQPDVSPQRVRPQWHGGGPAQHHEL